MHAVVYRVDLEVPVQALHHDAKGRARECLVVADVQANQDLLTIARQDAIVTDALLRLAVVGIGMQRRAQQERVESQILWARAGGEPFVVILRYPYIAVQTVP